MIFTVKLPAELIKRHGIFYHDTILLFDTNLSQGNSQDVEFSYSKNDGLKSTKTEEPRMVPIVPQIRNALIQLGNSNPHHDGYIFYSDACGIPMRTDKLTVGLKNMLIKLWIRGRIPPRANEATENEIKERKEIIRKLKADAKDYWAKRNVVFHSWRHFYSARMADKLDARKIMLATGHKTESVFQGYADHALENNLAEVADTTEKVFSGFIPENIIRQFKFEVRKDARKRPR